MTRNVWKKVSSVQSCIILRNFRVYPYGITVCLAEMTQQNNWCCWKYDYCFLNKQTNKKD